MTQQTYDTIVTIIEDLQVEGVKDDSKVYEIVRGRLERRNIEISKQELCSILADYM